MSDGAQTGSPLLPLGAHPGLDLAGRTLGDYLILRRLGQGGMGQVYLAEQVSLKRRVALKVLRPDLAANPTSLQRFKNEAEAVARATHANIVQVYAIGQADGLTFMALEYVEGRNLQEFVARKGPPDLLLALTIMRQVAAALQRASELGIVHRDVKPENILLTRKGEVKVADFGLSRCLAADQPPTNLTQSGVTMGTPLYMSPEQVEGKPLDPRTDVYSFGVTCYYMLTGQPPFRGESAFEVALQHVRAEPEPLAGLRPDLPEALCALVHKMMAKDPAARHQTCRELLKDIARVREGLAGQTGAVASGLTAAAAPATPTMVPGLPVPEAARHTQAVPTQPLRRRRRLVPMLFGLSLLLAAGGGILFAVWQRHRAEAAAPAAVVPAETDPTPHDLPPKREQALREAAEQYLSGPANTPLTSVDTGYNLCRDLAVMYLEEDRLDDAEKLFTRLETIRQHPFYRTLGHLGRGIVLALRNPQQPKESNKIFHDVFDAPFPLRGGGAAGRRGHPLLRGKLRYWIIKAIHYNVANGLPPSEVPRVLRPLLDKGRP